MTEGSITLSHAELDRVSVIRSIISRRLTPAQAAPRLQLSGQTGTTFNPRLPHLWCYQNGLYTPGTRPRQRA